MFVDRVTGCVKCGRWKDRKGVVGNDGMGIAEQDVVVEGVETRQLGAARAVTDRTSEYGRFTMSDRLWPIGCVGTSGIGWSGDVV